MSNEKNDYGMKFWVLNDPNKSNAAGLSLFLKGNIGFDDITKILDTSVGAKQLGIQRLDTYSDFNVRDYQIGETKVELLESDDPDEIQIDIYSEKGSVNESSEENIKICNQLRSLLGFKELDTTNNSSKKNNARRNTDFKSMPDLINDYLKENKEFIARDKADRKLDNFVYVNASCKEIIDSIKTTPEAMVDAMKDLVIAKETRDLFKIEPLVDLIKTYAASFGYDPTKDLKEILSR